MKLPLTGPYSASYYGYTIYDCSSYGPDLLSVEATTLPFTSILVAIAMPTLAIPTAHQVGTAMEAPLPGLFWQALISLLQTK